jgi:hypothetical protein
MPNKVSDDGWPVLVTLTRGVNLDLLRPGGAGVHWWGAVQVLNQVVTHSLKAPGFSP